jgi:hypothetical protein
MRLRGLLLASLCVLAACEPSPRRSSAAVAAVLDSLVVGPQIGAQAAPVAAALHLPFSPLVGYADTGFHAAAGVHGLVLRVDEALPTISDRPSSRARIVNIGIGFDTPAQADSARALLLRHLGAPVCYFVGDAAGRARWYFWPDQGPDGVLLAIPLNPFRHPYVVFGATTPEATPSRCDEG